MPAHVSEAIVLLTYPLKESDLIVSFLTRDVGKLRGVARRARRPKSGFGAGLGRLAHIRASYFARENRELVNLDSCDLLESQFGLASDYWATVALDYFAEIAEQLLPAQEPNEKFFRLLLAVLEHMRTAEPGAVWRAALYYTFWAVRLAGIFPELRNVSAESRALAGEIAVSPIAQFSPGAFEQNTAADLRRFLVRQIEDLTERKIKSYAALTARVAIA
jgi:DNA repair protein RecO (recombination protein O)